MRSPSVEDYLRSIFLLTIEDPQKDGVRSVDIAQKMGVTKPTVSSMIAKLTDSGLVESERYGNVRLTKKGLKEALRITHHYRVASDFLNKILGVSKTDSLNQAHALEHVLNEDTFRRIEEYIQKCGKCSNVAEEGIPLTQLKQGETGDIVRLECKGSLRRRLIEMGMIRGACVGHEKVAPMGDPLEISVLGYHLSIRKRDAKHVFVRRCKCRLL